MTLAPAARHSHIIGDFLFVYAHRGRRLQTSAMPLPGQNRDENRAISAAQRSHRTCGWEQASTSSAFYFQISGHAADRAGTDLKKQTASQVEADRPCQNRASGV
jgi:hypothetical protein